jgi:hypothetical protein
VILDPEADARYVSCELQAGLCHAVFWMPQCAVCGARVVLGVRCGL